MHRMLLHVQPPGGTYEGAHMHRACAAVQTPHTCLAGHFGPAKGAMVSARALVEKDPLLPAHLLHKILPCFQRSSAYLRVRGDQS